MAIAASSPLDWRWGKGVNKLSDAPMNGGSIARSTTYYKYFHKTIWLVILTRAMSAKKLSAFWGRGFAGRAASPYLA
jgi:hypothetical protein